MRKRNKEFLCKLSKVKMKNQKFQAHDIRNRVKIELTLPNTTCLPSRCGVGTVQMKNCEPFVLGPEIHCNGPKAIYTCIFLCTYI